MQHLIKLADRSVRRLTPEQLQRLDVLTRRVAIQLAQVRTRTRDVQLQTYLNGLLASAHSVMYVEPKRSITWELIRFVSYGFPRSIAENSRFHVASAALLIAGGLVAYCSSMDNLVALYQILPEDDVRQPGATQEQLLEVLRGGRDDGGGTKAIFASFLLGHNFKVAMLSLGAGILAMIPTVLLIFINGMLLGGFVAVHARQGLATEMWAWILPHGITELGAIVLCGGIGLKIGWSILCPGPITRTESLQRSAKQAVITAVGVGGMLVFAAIVESYLRQSHLSTAARLAFAAATALFWVGYIACGFMLRRRSVAAVGGLTNDGLSEVR